VQVVVVLVVVQMDVLAGGRRANVHLGLGVLLHLDPQDLRVGRVQLLDAGRDVLPQHGPQEDVVIGEGLRRGGHMADRAAAPGHHGAGAVEGRRADLGGRRVEEVEDLRGGLSARLVVQEADVSERP